MAAAAPALITAGAGLYAQNQAAQQQRQAEQRAIEAERQRVADFQARTAPVEAYYQSLLDPNHQAVSQGLQDQLYGQAQSRIEDAILKAQERARADALRRGIYHSGITGENLRDIEGRGMEQLGHIGADIASQANQLTMQQRNMASQGLQGLANMQDPGVNLATMQAQFAQQRGNQWQQFGNQLLGPAMGSLGKTLWDGSAKWWDNQWNKWLNPQPQAKPRQLSYDTSGIRLNQLKP